MPLLLFVVVLAVLAVAVAGVALGAPATTTLSTEVVAPAGSALSETYQMTAADLGGFGGEDTPSISSPSVIVEAMDTGKVLYSKKANTRRAMASTTKIMTAILVLESGVDLDSPR